MATKSNDEIIIKFAEKSDLESMLELDKKVSFDHFKPIFVQHYSHLSLGENPDRFLKLELKNDLKIFKECTANPLSDRQLLIAYDNKIKKCVGLILFHRESNRMEIDLILIDKNYRNLGIGKKLIEQSMQVFPNIQTVTVYALKMGNENALKFYKSLDFVHADITEDKKNIIGIPYKELYVCFNKIIKSN